ncbi:MAG TPA: hypothetical protein VJ302_30305 [Blastocatellia bacterium]|nr:hypothetical protein [Blastocatellia bacterium]
MLKGFSLLFCLITMLGVSRIVAAPPVAPPVSEDASLVIIVNKTNPVEDLSINDLRNLLLAEQRVWPHGRRVTIAMREPGQPERLALLKAICRMTDSDYNKYFLQAQFTGDLQSVPKLLTTVAGMRKFVFNVPGAIGYLRVSEVDASVKIVRLNGRLPSEPGYKLRLD